MKEKILGVEMSQVVTLKKKILDDKCPIPERKVIEYYSMDGELIGKKDLVNTFSEILGKNYADYFKK